MQPNEAQRRMGGADDFTPDQRHDLDLIALCCASGAPLDSPRRTATHRHGLLASGPAAE